ncbi:hypothetical protein EDB89DRAFT_1907584 [Lactarius sanguifluus]|nr:hypothetical protein EDB89DRAFT_1907584 [Lactarius sanguifluus]
MVRWQRRPCRCGGHGHAGIRGGRGGRVEMAPMRQGRPNAVGGNGRAGIVVAVEAVSRRRRWSGVEAGSIGGTVVARWQWRSCRGSWVGGVEVGAAAMLRWQGQDGNNRDGDNEAAYTRVPVSGRLGRLGARKGARMPRGVRAVGGGLDDEGDTVPRPAQVRDE